MKRTAWSVACYLLIGVFTLCNMWVHAEESITVVSWGGAFARASVEGYHKAFEKEAGIKVNLEEYNGGLAQVRAQVEAGNITWDVIDVEIADSTTGCDEGVFVEIDYADLPPALDGTPAIEDIYDEAKSDCLVPTSFYATVITYNDRLIGEKKPTTAADFFNLEEFPGRRGMRRVPLDNLEFALLGDGVPVEDVYKLLRTEEGLDRAFDKLESIKDKVIWWEAGAQPPQMLADGEVVMTTAWNGRIFNAQVYENQPFVILWDSQILSSGGLSIVNGTPRYDDALKFVQFASLSRSMAAVASYISYPPVRKSALQLVDKHAEMGVGMQQHLPTALGRDKTALFSDWEFWADNGDELLERFSTWLVK